jgi:hypothetical protein
MRVITSKRNEFKKQTIFDNINIFTLSKIIWFNILISIVILNYTVGTTKQKQIDFFLVLNSYLKQLIYSKTKNHLVQWRIINWKC